MKVNRMSDTYPPVASEVKPFAQHSNACQNVRPLTRHISRFNDFCVRHIQPKFFRQQQTVILIINALAEIERRIGLPDFANRQFNDVRRRRYSFRNAPVIAYSEQRCLLPARQQPRCESHFLL